MRTHNQDILHEEKIPFPVKRKKMLSYAYMYKSGIHSILVLLPKEQDRKFVNLQLLDLAGSRYLLYTW